MYLKSLQIERFRAFRHTDVSFRYPGAAAPGKMKYPNINLLLGNNGMGKSTALQAAALALMSPVIASTGSRPYSLVRREVGDAPSEATVKAHVALGDQDLEGDRQERNEATDEIDRMTAPGSEHANCARCFRSLYETDRANARACYEEARRQSDQRLE